MAPPTWIFDELAADATWSSTAAIMEHCVETGGTTGCSGSRLARGMWIHSISTVERPHWPHDLSGGQWVLNERLNTGAEQYILEAFELMR